jgi:probable F420-dependent oxidoreductase
VRFSLILPIPGPAAPEQVLEFAEAADELGFHGVYMNSRVALPADVASPHPYAPDGRAPWAIDINWPDAFVVFSALAACTRRLRFGPVVVPVIVTHPLVLAKQAATLDAYSGGRLELGLGAGWMLEEVRAIDRPTDKRWRRLEETIEILRLAWTSDTVAYAGKCYQFPAMGTYPHPVQGDKVPIWIGGHGPRAIEIAARFNTGLFLWGGYAPEKVADYVRRARQLSASVPVATLVDVATPPDEWGRLIGDMDRAGADMMVLSRPSVEGGKHLKVIKDFAARFLSGGSGGAS